MTRLSKAQLGDRGRFVFKQEEVQLEELDGSVMVRTPSVGQRDALAKHLPDDTSDWNLDHTAKLFATIVVEPEINEEEAKEFLADWPGTALDKIIEKWSELIGSEEVMREAAGDFQRTE